MVDTIQDFALFILMRKDMDSLNHAGKMVAQGAHAANHAASEIGKGAFGTTAMMNFSLWEKSTPQGFGTTLVFSGIVDNRKGLRGLSIYDITHIVDSARAFGIAAGLTHDPSYPLHDGGTVHGFPCDTCGWMFGSRDRLWPLSSNLSLQPAAPEEF